jgi:lipid II:glycine glycyltransferase (peptidoglycan interpeptide bridge formation enzyme)
MKNHLTSIIDLTKPKEKIWSNINATSKRMINKANREYNLIERNLHFNESYNLYKTFLKQEKFTLFNGFFSIFGLGGISKKTMKQYGKLFTASIENEVVAGIFFLKSQTSMHAWLGGSKRLKVEKENAKKISRAYRLIFWEAIQYAKNQGLIEFDLGGIFTDEEVKKDSQKKGIRDFKMQFGGKKVTRYQYQKIYSPTLKKLYKLFQ